MVISSLVLWSICLSSSLVHLRKGPEYLTRGTAQVFIPLMRFLLESFVSSGFLLLPRYSFRILSFIFNYYYYYYYYYYFTLLRVFHSSVSWWFSSWVWVTTSHLESPGLFLVFWPILIMKSFGLSPLALVRLNKAKIKRINFSFTFKFHGENNITLKFIDLGIFSVKIISNGFYRKNYC